jgi:hypothetical protein
MLPLPSASFVIDAGDVIYNNAHKLLFFENTLFLSKESSFFRKI